MSTTRSQKRSKIDSIVNENENDLSYDGQLTEPPPLPITFSRNVRRCRVERGWSIDELASRSGINPHYLKQIEAGKQNCSVSTVYHISKGLGVPMGELLGTRHKGLSETAKLVAWLIGETPPTVAEPLLKLLKGASGQGKDTPRRIEGNPPEAESGFGAAPWMNAYPPRAKKR